jgi:hypothetical protein
MYLLFRDGQTANNAKVIDPSRPYIQRQVKQQLQDVTSYYRRFPKLVDASNLFNLILSHFVLEFKSDDYTFARNVEQLSRGLIRNLGITDATNRGRIFLKGVTLGPDCEEVVISSIERFETDGLKSKWQELKPVRYLYHSRSDINLPIMNNRTPGKGYGVISINIPMLMVQYRHWVWRNLGPVDSDEINQYKFIGSYVLVNSLESYLDIAYFNRLARMASNLPSTKYPLPHPFYIPDLTPVVDKMAKNTLTERAGKAYGIEQLADITPMLVKQSLYEVLQLPKGPVTLQNEWALAIARLPYIKYLMLGLLQAPSFDKQQTNEILFELKESLHSQAFSANGNSPMIQRFLKDVKDLIELLQTT